ncbi:hypothetical protein LTR97_009555 [Elasticomyces elasticus]|uniref:F-box domain-containing protein n=1 Tax=Elasticomyces elasticus TaxID=574655 RepID=A0AAN7W1B8_9PEZI|nr:hypothetical protein LTR97_009555 [Elasticomyces elasticus]
MSSQSRRHLVHGWLRTVYHQSFSKMPTESPRSPVELPEELLQHIFSFLHEPANLQLLPSDRNARLGLSTLVNIALTNKTYNRIVRPELYHTLFIQDDSPGTRPILFLKMLLKHPETRPLLQELYSGLWSVDPSPQQSRCKSDETSHILRTAADHAGPGIPALSWTRIRTSLGTPGTAQAAIALLLTFTPQLRVLAFSITGSMAESLILTALRDVRLPHLSEVQVACEDQQDRGAMDGFIELLQRPALTIFRAHGMKCEDDSTTALATSSLSPKLQQIFFEHSFLDAIGIARLLTSAPGLRTLSVHWVLGTTRSSKIDFGAIGQVLRDHGTKLETLQLKTEDAASSLDSNSSLGDLKDVVSLRRLALPHHALCGLEDGGEIAERSPDHLTKILPRSLRELEIRFAKDVEMVGMSEDGLYEEEKVEFLICNFWGL